MVPFIEISRICKYLETESRLVAVKGWKQEGIGSNCLMGMGFFFGRVRRK